MHDNDDNGHRTPLRWPPRVGRRQWKQRAGMQPADEAPIAHPGSADRERDVAADEAHGHERPPRARQPNERDAAVEREGVPGPRSPLRRTIRRGHDDLASGRVDTDLRNHMQGTYDRLRGKPRKPR